MATRDPDAQAIPVLRDERRRRFPDEHDLLVMLGLALGQNGDLEEAIGAWRRALALQPGRAHSLANLGLLLTRINRPEEGAMLFRQAISVRCRTSMRYP